MASMDNFWNNTSVTFPKFSGLVRDLLTFCSYYQITLQLLLLGAKAD